MPSATVMQVVEITDAETLEALHPEWRALVDACPSATPFQAPEWLIAWREAFLPNGLWVLAVREGARLLGVAPFFIHLTPQGERQLTLLGNGISDRLDLLAAPDAREAAGAAVFSHLRSSDRWDSLDFRDLPADSSLLGGAIGEVAEDAVGPEPPCPTVRLDGGAAGLPERRRRDLARCERRLREQGRPACRTADAHSRAQDLDALMRLHEACWRARGGKGALAEPAARQFHDRVSGELLADGRLRLDLLTLDERPIAAHYGFRQNGRGYSYLHGYDPALAACAPGRLLLARVIDEARRDSLSEFDFLRGAEAYKYEWGARDRPQFRRRARR